MVDDPKRVRRDKKIIFQLSYLSLELEEAEDFMKDYIKKFNEDFKNELEYLVQKNSNQPEQEETESSEDISEFDVTKAHPVLHQIYRSIVKKTHPDFWGEEYIELFKEAGDALKKESWVKIITIANELKIELPKLEDDIVELIENNAEDIKNSIQEKKNTLAWVWNNTNKKDSLIKYIYKHLKIDKEDFKRYLKEQNKS